MIKKLNSINNHWVSCRSKLVLLILPVFKGNGYLTNIFYTKDILSYKDAVRIASPAVVNVYNQAFAFTTNNYQPQINNRFRCYYVKRWLYID